MHALIWELSGEEGSVAIALVRDCLLTRDSNRGPQWTIAVYSSPVIAHVEGVRLTEYRQKRLPTILGPAEVDLPLADVQRARFDMDTGALAAAVEAQLDKLRELR